MKTYVGIESGSHVPGKPKQIYHIDVYECTNDGLVWLGFFHTTYGISKGQETEIMEFLERTNIINVNERNPENNGYYLKNYEHRCKINFIVPTYQK